MEQLISFSSEGLNDYEGRYIYVKKKVLYVVRALKKIRLLLSHNNFQLLVPHSGVKDFLLNKDIDKKRVWWITKFMESEIDINITRLKRDRGICE